MDTTATQKQPHPSGPRVWENPSVLRWFLQLALAFGYFSAVADRLGLWGPPGHPGVVWGDFHHFLAYTGILNPWCPAALLPALGVLATIAETAIGIGLVSGWKTRAWALASGVLLLLFAVSMSYTTGIHSVLNYSVLTDVGASFLLAAFAGESRRRDA